MFYEIRYIKFEQSQKLRYLNGALCVKIERDKEGMSKKNKKLRKQFMFEH